MTSDARPMVRVTHRFDAETTRVSVDIVPRENGCELTLTHEGVLPDYAERTKAGWTEILERLAAGLTE